MKRDDWRDLDGANGDGYFDRHGAKDFKRVRARWWVWPIVWFVAGLGVWQCSHAQVVLTYNGQPIVNSSAVQAITGTITLAAPLAPNGTQIVVPIDYNLTENYGQIFTPVSTEGAAVGPLFSFTTVNGVITAWNILLQDTSLSDASITLNLTDSGDSYEIDTASPDCGRFPSACTSTVTSNTTAGAWSMPQAQVAQAMASMNSQLATMQSSSVQMHAEINQYAAMYVQMLGWCRKQKGVC